MSEGAPLCLSPVHGPRKANSVGPAVPETQLQIVDTETGENVLASGQLGEVRVRGPQLMAGYRNESEATARAMRNGWLYTGDLGKLDTDGYLFLLGRKKDMVLVGGYNVYPRQVEERLLTHQSVTEVACVGVPDERLGEVLVAFTVCRVDNAMKEDDFHSFGRQHLVKYCRPERVHFLTSLPRTQAHKLDLRLLKQWAIEPQQIGAQYLRSEVCHSFR